VGNFKTFQKLVYRIIKERRGGEYVNKKLVKRFELLCGYRTFCIGVSERWDCGGSIRKVIKEVFKFIFCVG
jgi:hypothetical protein